MNNWAAAACLPLWLFAAGGGALAQHASHEDHSGRRIAGRASYYSSRFNGRRMADTRRFMPQSNSAASKVLPLGTTARVTNLQNGKQATVTVEDRGPYVANRVVDLSPRTAAELGIGKTEGVAPVVVAPVSVPQPDGTVKAGAGATEPTRP